MKKITAVFLLSFLIISFVPVQAQWQKIILPGSSGGAVYTLCVKDSLLFAGIDAGVFRSSDDGAHWTKINPLFPSRYYNPLPYSLVANGQYLVAGFSESGIYISSDNGNTWDGKLIGKPRSVPYEIAASGNWIIAGYPISPPNLSVQSTDNGENWTSLAVSNIVTATIEDSIALARAYYGIYRSTDYGATWTNVHTLSLGEINGGYPIVLSQNHAYAGKSNLFYGNGYILSSSDKGLTWQDSTILNCTTINSITVSPTENNYVFAATDSGVFRSSDYGVNWTSASSGLTSSLIFSLAFKEEGTGVTPMLFAGTGDGIFRSTDYGDTWTATGSPSDWIFSSSDNEVFAISSNSLYDGYSKYHMQAKYIFRTSVITSTDNGENWTEAFTGFMQDSSQVSSFCINKQLSGQINLFAGGLVGGSSAGGGSYIQGKDAIVFVSSDLGIHWTKSNFDTSYSNVLLLGNYSSDVFTRLLGQTPSYGGLFKTTDNGNSWAKVDSSFLFYNAFTSDGNNIYAGGSDTRTIFVGRQPKTFMLSKFITSTDKGDTWANIVTPLDTGKTIITQVDTVSIVASLYSTGANLFVGMQALYFKSEPYGTPVVNGGGLFHLHNSGSNWELIDTTFSNRQIFSFTGIGANIYAATDSGVFRTSNNGASWNDISFNMNRLNVSSLFISGTYLYASTTNGLWRCPLSAVTLVDNMPNGSAPDKFTLYQNYPNPFNPSTIISYQLPTAGYVTLKVYDVLGREVATLANEEERAGIHKINFNAARLSSGVYFYQLTENNFVATKKIVLLK